MELRPSRPRARAAFSLAWHHPVTALAVKSAAAAGLAFWLGGLLPGDLGEYRYYAALGAYSVIYPSVSDSVVQGARAVVGVLLGALLAMALQLTAWTNPITVGLAVGLGVVVGAWRWLRDQTTWVPVVALFVLAVGGARPEGYVEAYVVQIVLGAVVGTVVNFVAFAPLPLHELQTSTTALRRELARQLRAVANALADEGGRREDNVLATLPDVGPARERVRLAIAEARSARRANPRAPRTAHIHRALFDLGETLQRCSTAVESMAIVVLDPNATELPDDLRRRTADLMAALATLFEAVGDEVPDEEHVAQARRAVDGLIEGVESESGAGRESRYVAGAAAVSGLRCLEAFVTAQRRSGADATVVPGPPPLQP
ncbi:hypothetical protein N798_02315 [Knoellia flava TL1]|uniref:FUSC family protein n=2 Tax=Knoellia flava TaxID=913969 RepID=A0A8H9FUZ1_9MICO|nr:hypothetical protein [Knoellia flava]KGN35633.1 hypothetical protein N798_02315 [Knoellia flava TL1]GGB76863.1 hypothetical protein GCM10011314_15610 [Knoellia flava]